MSARDRGADEGPRLLRASLPAEPLTLFDRWYAEALAAGVEAETMALATVAEDGVPDVRNVLMRAVQRDPGREGIVFFTNYTSDKGRALEVNPACALNFYWGDLAGSRPFGARQVRVRGLAERVPTAVSDAYFAQRPRLSQLGAWASPQSAPIDEDALEARLAEVERRFSGSEVPRPPHWGGYLVVIGAIELWQGRGGRLHDRFRYTRAPAGWAITRLAP